MLKPEIELDVSINELISKAKTKAEEETMVTL